MWYKVKKVPGEMTKEPSGELRVTFALPKEVEAELTAPPPAPTAATAGAPNLLYVTIESGRGLLAMDRNNSSDPFVKLSISKQKHQTATIEKTLKPHWDEKFAFLLADPMQTLDVLVEDEDRTINDFLGRAQVVLADVLQPHVERELTVKLLDKKLREDKDRGTIQLRLRWIYEPDADVMLASRKRISVRTKHAKSVLQSDDESDEDFADDDVIDDESDDDDDQATANDLSFLVATIHRAEDLPPLDTVLFETEKATRKHHGGGIDVYVGAALAKRPEEFVRTRIHAKKGRRDELRSNFHENLMLVLPKDEPTSDVTLSVMDWDPLNNDDLVARVELPNVQALAAQSGGKPFWLNLYGAPVKGVSDKSVANRMNEQQSAGSTYRGRVLLTLKVVGKSSGAYEAKNQKRIARKLPRELFPESSVYRMRAHFVSGIGLPKGKFSLALSCGLHEIASTRKPAVNGSIDWNETEGSDKMLFPAAAAQIPDVFLYLYKGEDEKRRVVCFKRFTAAQLLAATASASAGVQWVTLAADRSMDVVDADATFAGKVLVRLGLSSGGSESWDQRAMFDQVNRRIPYQVRVRVLEARKLVTGKAESKAEDLAAGVTVQCWDELRISKAETKKKTSNPLFSETFCIDVNLPKREFVPQVLLHVKNQTGNQEYIGTAAFDVAADGVVCTSQQIKTGDAQLPEPKWLPIVAETLEGEVERGQILASVQLIQKQFPDETFPEPAPLNVQSTQI